MTQYDDTVERQRLMLEAEEWAGKTKGVHAHSIRLIVVTIPSWYLWHPVVRVQLQIYGVDD